jgi:hypothetical protein
MYWSAATLETLLLGKKGILISPEDALSGERGFSEIDLFHLSLEDRIEE